MITHIPLYSPQGFDSYSLIDSGEGEKLEQYGEYVIARPEPQALWTKTLPEAEWQKRADGWFKPATGKEKQPNGRGAWVCKPSMPHSWFIRYSTDNLQLRFKLSLTSFGHIGLFPEQQCNWLYIYDTLRQMQQPEKNVLNLFAYTGAASLAARAAGANVVHVDAVKPMITWARENMEASQLNNIQWVVEDALKFVKREVRRKKKYHGIILDPPAYGRGPDGEKWLLETCLPELLSLCRDLLSTDKHFLILNMYSLGYSPLIAGNLLKGWFPDANPEIAELYLQDKNDKKLPAGIYSRFSKPQEYA